MRYLLAIGLCCLLGIHAAVAEVQIAQIQYQGWDGSYYLTNGNVEAVIVPAIGRVMRFAFVGGESPLWENPAWIGKSREDVKPNEWANFGGDKNWTAPQSDWPKYLPRSWPPDFAFDGEPHAAEVLDGNVLQMTSPLSEATGLRVIRQFELAPTEARLEIRQTFVKEQGEPVDVSIWSITQVSDADALYMPLDSSGEYVTLSNQLNPKDWRVEAGWLHVSRNREKAAKVGASSPGGWLAWVKEDLLFRIQGGYQVDATYPDSNCNIEIYTSADPLHYSELELLSPISRYEVGDRRQVSMTWELVRLPEGLSPEERRAAIERSDAD